MSTGKFNQALRDRVMGLAGAGRTNAEIAEDIGVAPRTLVVWRKKYEGFDKSLLECKTLADDLVEASLFARAVGYSCPETKVMNSFGVVLKEDLIKHYPPDTTACIFWLKNRQPARWRERIEEPAQTIDDLIFEDENE